MKFLSRYKERILAWIREQLTVLAAKLLSDVIMKSAEREFPDLADLKIDVYRKEGIATYYADGIAGTRLRCRHPTGLYLVAAEECCDQGQFWRLWQQFGGQATWDDGMPFVPPV